MFRMVFICLKQRCHMSQFRIADAILSHYAYLFKLNTI